MVADSTLLYHTFGIMPVLSQTELAMYGLYLKMLETLGPCQMYGHAGRERTLG